MTPADFYRISAPLTGYDEAQLRGTGVGETYLEVLSTLIPATITHQLQDAFLNLSHDCDDTLNEQIRIHILSNEKLGPVARNIIKMWYLSIWYPMPQDWTSNYSEPTQTPGKYEDVEFIISEDAYIQGFAWDALKSHPMGAKQPGWATWSFAPEDISHHRHHKHHQ